MEARNTQWQRQNTRQVSWPFRSGRFQLLIASVLVGSGCERTQSSCWEQPELPRGSVWLQSLFQLGCGLPGTAAVVEVELARWCLSSRLTWQPYLLITENNQSRLAARMSCTPPWPLHPAQDGHPSLIKGRVNALFEGAIERNVISLS